MHGAAGVSVFAGALAGDGVIDAVIAEDALELRDVGEQRHVLQRQRSRRVRSEAIISGKAAFLAPEIGITPLSRLAADDLDLVHYALAVGLLRVLRLRRLFQCPFARLAAGEIGA